MSVRRFRDRAHAGELLAQELVRRYPTPPVIAAIPRGGVVVAAVVAERLGVSLGVVQARKLTAPPTPEIAFGAVDEDGKAVVDYPLIAGLRLSEQDVEAAKARVLAEVRGRVSRYGVPPLATLLPAPVVVLIDDGLATGLTMEAAVDHARRHGARKVIVATPCASSRAAVRFLRHADGFVSLVVDDDFRAVADYYGDFAPVSDEDVLAILAARGLGRVAPSV